MSKEGSKALNERPWIPLLVLVFVVLIAHGMLLVNDGIYWDGWIVTTELQADRWDSVRHWYFDAGLPVHYFYLTLLKALPGKIQVVANILSFGWLVLGAWSVYGIAKRFRISSGSSLMIGMVAATFPSFQGDAQLVLAPYVASLGAFLCAAFLALWATDLALARRVIVYIASSALFLFSFGLSSLLVYYFAFLLLLAVRAKASNWWGLFAYFACLPIVFWRLKVSLVPTTGAYSDYNQIHPSLHLIRPIITAFSNSVLDQFALLQGRISSSSIAMSIVVLVTAAGILARKYLSEDLEERRAGIFILGFGTILLALAYIPYVLVGKSPSAQGWDTRHALLVAPALAAILVSIVSLASAHRPVIGRVVLIGLISLFASACFVNEITLVNRWVKDREIIEKLPGSGVAPYSIVTIGDQLAVGPDAYRFYEWTSMFRASFGDQKRVALVPGGPTAREIEKIARQDPSKYSVSDFDPRGRECVLQVLPDQTESAQTTAIRYLYRRITSSGSVPTIVRLQVIPVIEASPPVGRQSLLPKVALPKKGPTRPPTVHP